MGEKSLIGWTDNTFNAWEGCTNTSPGCDLCYAERRDRRFHKGDHWGAGAPRRRTSPSNWKKPLQWDQRSEITGYSEKTFLESLGDICDPEVPQEWREDVWRLIRGTRHLTWILLTKRSTLIEKLVPADIRTFSNVWMGVTVENREHGLPRIARLKRAWCSLRWLSIEPLLEDLYLTHDDLRGIDWVVIGGEYDPNARLMDVHWAYRIIHTCFELGIPVFFKQHGSRITSESHGGCDIFGDVLQMHPGDSFPPHYQKSYELISSLTEAGTLTGTVQ